MTQPPEGLRQEIELRKTHLTETLHSLFPTPASITLEIGCGHGHYLVAYAQQYSQEYCIGIDILKDRIDRGLKKLKRAHLDNLAFIQASAEEFLEVLPSTVSIKTIFILFPEPWPKKKHHRRRVIQESFLNLIAQHSKSGTHIYFRTDDVSYYNWTIDLFNHHPSWEIVEDIAWRFEYVTCFQEKMEKYNSLIAVRK